MICDFSFTQLHDALKGILSTDGALAIRFADGGFETQSMVLLFSKSESES